MVGMARKKENSAAVARSTRKTRAGARDAGDHGQALAEPDQEGRLQVDLIERLDARSLREALDDEDGDAAHDQ